MIICRTPLRISFFGGGTDYPVWYNQHGGLVLSATINKYNFLTVRELPPFFPFNYRIRYHLKEETRSIDEVQHPAVRECVKYLDFKAPLDIVHSSDLPARSGLGSSSSFSVGLLHALQSLRHYMPTKRELALQALHVEQERIKEAVGSQDQVAAAFGGLNVIRFHRANQFDVDPVIISRDRLSELEGRLLLCFTGFARTASDVAKEQIAATPDRTKELTEMTQLCERAISYLQTAEASLDRFGELLNQQWVLKRSLTASISNPIIDEIYSRGLRGGAIGAKLLGAGGGGFMLFYAPPEAHAGIRAALAEYLFVPFRFEFTGSKVVYFDHH